MGHGELKNLIDIPRLQALMGSFYLASSIPVWILDTDGKLLVATGWQDVCAKYHRVHPDTCAKCKVSDAYIKSNLRVGEYIEYKCQNNMWDLATPIVIKGRHVATLFLGQFFYEDETVDMEFFRRQAAKYGFPVESYLDALAKVPVYSRKKVKNIMDYYMQFVQMLINMGLARLELEDYQANLQKLADERAQKVLESTTSLRESEKKYRQLFQQATDYILVFEPAVEGPPKIVDASDSAFEKHGYTRDELLGKPLTFLDTHSSDVNVAERMKILGSGKPLTFEAEHHRKDGSTFVVEVTAKMIKLDGKRFLYAIERDITGRIKAAEALKESETLFRQIFQTSNTVKILYDPETGKLFDANDAACRFYGYTRKEMVSKSLYEINTLPPSELKAGIEEAKTEKRNYFIVRHRLASGEVRDVEVYASPVIIGGKTLNYSIIHDITERKKSDNLLRCRAELSSLVATASVDELIQSGLDAAERLTSSQIGYFHFVNDDQENLTLQTWSTNTLNNMCKAEGKGMHYPISKAGVWVDCFRQRKPVIHNDYAALPHKKGLPEGHAPVIRELTIPIIQRGKVVAIMGVGNKKTDYTQEDVEITVEAASILFDLVQRKRAEEALRVSEKRLVEAQKMAKIGDWTWSRANNALTWSDEVYHIFGLDKATYIPTLEKYAELVHPGDRHIMLEVNYLENIGKKSHEIEYRIIAQDTGEIKYVFIKGETEFGENGKPLFVRGTLQDITERKRTEESARRAGEELLDLYNQAPCGYHSLDKNGVFVRINDTELRWLGYSREEVIGKKKATDFMTEESREVFRRTFPTFLATGEIHNLEFEWIRKDGSIFNITLSATAVRNDKGEIVQTRSTIFDITARKRMEQALRDHDFYLLQAQKVGGFGSYIYDIKADRWSSSEMLNEIFGIGADFDRSAAGWVGFIHSGDREALQNALLACIDGKKNFDMEYRIIRPIDGNERWLHGLGEVEYGADGRPARIVGTNTDITERKNAEREKEQLMLELSRKSTETNAILASQNNVILTYDLNMNVQQVNPAFFKIYGFDPVGLNVKEIIRRVNCRMMDGSPLNLEEQPTPRALRGEVTDSRLYQVTKADGTSGFVDTSSRPLLVGGTLAGSVTVWHDVTDLKMKERELRAAKEAAEAATTLKDKFVSLVAHDLKSPLSSMTGFLKLVRDDEATPLDEGAKLILDKAIDSGKQLSRLIDDLLNLNRLKSGQLKLDKQFFDAKYLGAKMCADFSYSAGNKGITLTNLIPDNSRVFGDRTLLGEALQNLVTNAIKFCRKGDTITISLSETDRTAIQVKDTGPGMKPEALNKLFKFESAVTTAGTAGETGTGLGLPLARDILLLHGGDLEAVCEIGIGCVFTLKIPYVRPRILIVDDDPAFRFLLAQLLTSVDADIMEAEDGVAAMDIIATGKDLPHLIISDIEMPRMTGLELLLNLQRRHETQSIPVIVVSGRHGMEIRETVYGLGGKDFLTKQLDVDDFIPRVKRFIS